ncbi:MAG: MFS transporter, partial [Anaerolineae bacterium]|nr:MFS transporter [Anaerolineae bacterium]
LSLSGGVGAVGGGLGIGWLEESLGFKVMLAMLATFLLLWPISASLIEEKGVRRAESENARQQKQAGLGKSFYLLFFANILASVAGFFIVLIRSISMNDLGFNSFEISSTGAIGGLIALPLPMIMGWFSDRLGRKTFLHAGYLVAMLSIVMLAFSNALWHFWIVIMLQGISMGNAGAIGNAVVTDLLPKESLARGMALFGSTGWIGGVIGFAVAGWFLQNLGFTLTFVIGGILAFGAVVLLFPIKLVPQT